MDIYSTDNSKLSTIDDTKELSLFHSFRSEPFLEFNRYSQTKALYSNLWYFAWGVLSAKSIFPECVFNLHTDNKGAEYLGSLPYDSITTDLEGVNQSKYLWAAGKFTALKNESLGAIHIDGDVILSNLKAKQLLSYEGNDVICQNKEGLYKREIEVITPILPFASTLFNKGALCCGVVGINNQALKDSYILEYESYSGVIRRNETFIAGLLNSNSCIAFDLLFEQSNLYNLCLNGNYNVKTLCRNLSELPNLKYSGYEHFMGRAKYEEANILRAKEAVKALNIDFYNLLMEKEYKGL